MNADTHTTVAGRAFDGQRSPCRVEDMAFTELMAAYHERTRRTLDMRDLAAWGVIDERGGLTNAGALLADHSPLGQSRIVCTLWDGLPMAEGLGRAIDVVELGGSVISQLREAVAFVHSHSCEGDASGATSPDYPERAVTGTILNAILHRDYTQAGSRVRVDMYDDRVEVWSPGVMIGGESRLFLNLPDVPAVRRNPLLADCFGRLGLLENGDGIKEIGRTYERYRKLVKCRLPEFGSDTAGFRVVLWNLNYAGTADAGDGANGSRAFARASRQICQLISRKPNISIEAMSRSIRLSKRQVMIYIGRLREAKKIARVGNKRSGEWKILDEDYAGTFDKSEELRFKK
ncbi:MAG: hypothetical protein LUC18_01430 [Porphyromonadaceae bacterium]|nr:hypothetical protein [Porphyromonadaceae bacterium]